MLLNKNLKPLVEGLNLGTDYPTGGCGSISDEYVAGLFDGCGSVVTRHERIKGKHEQYSRIRMHIELLGMKITGSRKIKHILNRIKDHVVLKKESVRLALEFCETVGDGKTPLKKTERGLREIVHARFKVLGEKK